MKTGNTPAATDAPAHTAYPQWSPVMKTGNTRPGAGQSRTGHGPSMEPGHEDREYVADPGVGGGPAMPSMEPGHEDREYLFPRST